VIPSFIRCGNRIHALLLCGLALAVAIPLEAQEYPSLLAPKLRDLLHEELSGELAKEHVIEITRHNRIQSSRGYRAAAQYVLAQLRQYGFDEKDAFIESFPSDGKLTYQTWQSPSGWDIQSAELRMIEPFEERIVGYPEIAMSVITDSNPGEVTAELVWVGAGVTDADYTGKDVAGKMVLATGYGGDVHRLAVLKYGARAVVCYLDDERAKEHPDMLQYTGMWPRAEELDRVTFGFNLTNRQGKKLRDLLLDGKKVVLKGSVSGIGLEPYFIDVVVATIRGSERPEEELIFSAHLDHPKESANDNASGSAAILDIARTFKSLIESGKLPHPKRSLRFLWVPEWNGTMAYVDAHPELVGPALGGNFLANLNLDMVGEQLELLHSQLIVTQTPDSLPSALNDLLTDLAAMVAQMNIRTLRGSLSNLNYQVTPYSGGSDHMMFIDRKIPGIMISHSPDYTHHTSEDTPDKVDPVELERSEIIAAGALWYLANLDPAQALEWVSWTGAKAAERLGLAALRGHRLMMAMTKEQCALSWAEAQNILNLALNREKEVMASILHFNDAADVKAAVTAMQELLGQQYISLTSGLQTLAKFCGVEASAVPTLEPKIDGRIPVRLTRGPLNFSLPESRQPESERAWYRSPGFPLHGDARFELVNFIDGKRSVSEIRNALSAEFTPIKTEVIARYLEDLVKAGVVKWK
jgi:aminopeptidase YwaD